MATKIVVFELNEVPFSILDYYVQQRPQSRFAEVLGRSVQYTTIAADPQPLSPWTTWPTQHRGVPEGLHGIHDLGQDLTRTDEQYPPIWKQLVDGGVSTGVFGCLHSNPLPSDAKRYAFYVPDCFADDARCWPTELDVFQRFNLAMVDKSGRNVSSSIDVASARPFLRKAHSLGLKASTAATLSKQLISEQLRPWTKIRRRSLQSVVAFDLFLKQLHETRPQYAAFFSNHVASAMHRYWAAVFPGDYAKTEFDDEWKQRYSNEILWAMDIADNILGSLVDFAHEDADYEVIVTSSMGQAAAKTKPLKRKITVANLDRLMAAAGFGPDEYQRRRAMDANVGVMVDEGRADELVAFLASVRIDGRPIRPRLTDGGFVSWWTPGTNLGKKFDTVVVGDRSVALSEIGLVNLKVQDEADSSAYHVPEGIFVVYDPATGRSGSLRPEVSTLAVAPFLLNRFGLPVPDYMESPGAITTAPLESHAAH